MGGEHDAFIKVIIVERIVKSLVLIALAIGLIFAGRSGLLTQWADYAQDQLNLNADNNVIEQILFRLLAYIGTFTHTTALPSASSPTPSSRAPRASDWRCGAAGRST
jgi:hypothetical protein